MKITHETTNPEIEEYIKTFSHNQKVIRAQLLHQRRICRVEHRKEEEKTNPLMSRVRPQYKHSIFDREK